MEKAGIRGIYRTLPTKEDELEEVVSSLRTTSVSGVNVTIPFKEKVIRYLDGLSEEAEHIGAVNTIKKESERIEGYNTDCQGFLKTLDDLEFMPWGRKVLILGSGGAARAICYGLMKSGVASLTIASRNKESSENIVSSLSYQYPASGYSARPLLNESIEDEVEASDLIINTTPLGSGAFPGVSPLPENAPIHAGQVVVDIVYEPSSTPLLQQAELAGATPVNGLRMLVHQALESLRIWLDVSVDVEYILNRL
jgi:shikimate dehydrogenase